jgi:hypothetical protein
MYVQPPHYIYTRLHGVLLGYYIKHVGVILGYNIKHLIQEGLLSLTSSLDLNLPRLRLC